MAKKKKAEESKKVTKEETTAETPVVDPAQSWNKIAADLDEGGALGDAFINHVIDTINYFTDVKQFPPKAITECMFTLFKKVLAIPDSEPVAILRGREYLIPSQVAMPIVFQMQIREWLKTQIISLLSDEKFVSEQLDDALVQYWSILVPNIMSIVTRDPKTGKWQKIKLV